MPIEDTSNINLSLLFANAENQFDIDNCFYLIQQLSEVISPEDCKKFCSYLLFEMNSLIRDLARAAVVIDNNEMLDIFRVIVLDITNASNNLPEFLTHDTIFSSRDWLDRQMLQSTISSCLKSAYFVEATPTFYKYASPIKHRIFAKMESIIEKGKTDCA